MASSPYPHTDRDLLARITRSTGQKSGYKQLIRELGLGGGRERRLLLEQLGLLVARGHLTQPEDDVWAIPKSDPATPGVRRDTTRSNGIEAQARSGRDRLIGGRLDLHRDGFGFVRPDASGKTGRTEDIFIPPNEINGAMQGDLVLVDEAAPGRDGRRSGKIARVLTRSNPTVVGVFHYAGSARRDGREASVSGNFVTPLDERVGSVIAIPDGAEVVPVRPESPHRTLGDDARRAVVEPLSEDLDRSSGGMHSDLSLLQKQGAKGLNSRSRDPWRPLEGLAVDVEITDFPTPGRPARGRVIEVLGPLDAFGVDVEIVIRKHHIPHTFPAPVLAEAAHRAQESVATLTPDDLREREDFRALPIVTIDGETARDFDDAVLVRPLENGNTELQVHIADVSWYVHPGSVLDTEARVRGTSVYFPDRAVPMLPHALSSGMCSLLPNEDRLVLSCVMEIDPRGEIVGYRVCEGLIRSVMRMTYTNVQHCIDASPNAATWNANRARTPEPSAEDIAQRERIASGNPALPAAFDRMLDLALRLNAKRARRGSIDFDLPEPVVEFDPDGNMKAIVRSERGWAHRLIEEFMLSANECVATWLERTGIPSIYRIHEMPDPKRIVDFEETAAAFGHSLGIGNLPVRKLTLKADRRDTQRRNARGKDSRAAQTHEIPERIPVTPQMYQKLVKRISGHPEERILAYLMLRSLKQARYAEKNEGHFALASPSYTHFTSPIRRYPDLIVHRLLRAMLRRGANPRGGPIISTDAQPWQVEMDRSKGKHAVNSSPEIHVRKSGRWAARFFGNPTTNEESVVAPIAAEELNDIALESSQAERRAADAERELIEWKKIKFMQDRIGEDFHAIILSVTKYGFFVELNDIFIEGLVPLNSLVGDFYSFRDTDRTLCGARTGHCFAIGQKVEVLLDRIDREQRRLQFALLGTEPKAPSLRASSKKTRVEEPRPALTTKRSGKSKTRQRNKKSKGKR